MLSLTLHIHLVFRGFDCPEWPESAVCSRPSTGTMKNKTNWQPILSGGIMKPLYRVTWWYWYTADSQRNKQHTQSIQLITEDILISAIFFKKIFINKFQSINVVTTIPNCYRNVFPKRWKKSQCHCNYIQKRSSNMFFFIILTYERS